MKRPILRVLGFILLLLGACTQLPQDSSSSSSSVSSIPTSQNLKSYMGAASIGDIVLYGIDDQNKNLIFSNLTRQYYWSATYTEQEDGTMKFTIPVINEDAYFLEIPDKLLVVLFAIRDEGKDYPAFAVLAPHTIQSSNDMAGLNNLYFYLEAERISEGDYKGLYNLEAAGILVTPSNAIHYDKSNNGNLLYPDPPVSIGFDNNNKMCYVEIPEGPNTNKFHFVASDKSFVLDRGINKGFAFGCTFVTNAPGLDDIAGTYVVMGFEQRREAGQTNLDYNHVTKMKVMLSNTGSHLDVYLYNTNNQSFEKGDTLQIVNFQSIDGKINAYCLYSTNQENENVIVIGDTNYAFMFHNRGEASNINDLYDMKFGFIKKISQ